jgi:hypothetical protein
MRMLSRTVILAASLAGLTQVAHADCLASGCYTVYIEQLMPTATNGVWIQTSGNETLMNCTADSGLFIHLPAGTPKEIYSTLLAAHMADKLVSIVVNQGTNPCTVSYAYLNRQ